MQVKSPAPSAVKQLRLAKNLTSAEAAAMVHVKVRAWQLYESGDSKMKAGLWELFQLKTKGKTK
jgi:DNA-binding transcriptional regulator YiaG